MKKLSHIEVFHNIKLVSAILWNRVNHDRLTISAAGLAYTTILALVPLFTLVFSILSAFPGFEEVSLSLKAFIYSHLVPTTTDTIQNYLEQFIANTQKMTWFGIVGLVVTSLLLISTIDNALNHIWKTRRRRSFINNLAMYWTIMTLCPILIGTSMAISSYIFSLKWFAEAETSGILLRILPFLISVIGFWILYSIIPSESIPFKESMIGAFVGATLFEFSKSLFSIYVTSFPTYQLIYGVLSSIPIMLIWIYFSWCIVLFGAEFAASLNDFKRIKIKFARLNGGMGKEEG